MVGNFSYWVFHDFHYFISYKFLNFCNNYRIENYYSRFLQKIYNVQNLLKC